MQNGEVKYKLCGIICHTKSQSLNGGHFVSYVNHKGVWIYIDDCLVIIYILNKCQHVLQKRRQKLNIFSQDQYFISLQVETHIPVAEVLRQKHTVYLLAYERDEIEMS